MERTQQLCECGVALCLYKHEIESGHEGGATTATLLQGEVPSMLIPFSFPTGLSKSDVTRDT